MSGCYLGADSLQPPPQCHPCIYKSSDMELRKCRSGGTEASVPPRADGSRSSCGLSTDAQHRDRCPSHVQPNSRMTSIAHTRQVTVARIICGVDVSSSSLEGRIGREGAAAS